VSDFPIRKLQTHEEFEQVRHIQKIIWQHSDIELTSTHQYILFLRTGAILLGAFEGEKIVGFVFSFPAVFPDRSAQHSRQLAVLPEYRKRGIGKRLKWAQRREAGRMGFEWVTWTADPLLARNADLNFHTLGARAKTYLTDYYAALPNLALAPGLATDRLLIEWSLLSPEVARRKRGSFPPRCPDRLEKIVEVRRVADRLCPRYRSPGRTDGTLLIEVPGQMTEMKKDPDLISQWQIVIRRAFRACFRLGFAVTDFVSAGTGCYILEKIMEKSE
jgi:predicted GNAT superfamily acetyltransferase